MRHRLLDSLPLRSLLILSAASVAAVLGITYAACWVLAPIGLMLFFYDLWTARSWKGAFWRGFVFGLATGGAGIWWFWDTLPLDWLGLAGSHNGWPFVLLSWGPVTIMFACVTAVMAIPLWKVRSLPYASLAAALLWAITEEARMWGFSILTYADRGLLGPHFSATSIGYPLAENPYLLQLAEGGGVFFLNGVTALIALVGVAALRRTGDRALHTDRIGASFALILILLVPLVSGYQARAYEPLVTALIATDIPVGTVGGENRFKEVLERAVAEVPDADLIVLPEEFRLNPPFTSADEKQAYFSGLFEGRDVLVVSGKHVPAHKSPGFDITLLFDDETGATRGTYVKRFLMPGGEYMPHAMLAVFKLAPDSGLSRYLNSIPQIAPERTELVAVPLGERVVGGLVCSDFLSPQLNRELAVRHGANVLVNSANPAWFHYSPSLYTKTLQVSKVHAVQNRAYYLQASNGAPAFAINPKGELVAESSWRQTSVTRVEI